MTTPTKEQQCLCGHEASAHDSEDFDGECVEVCPCSGFTTVHADSNLRLAREAGRLLAENARLRGLLEMWRARSWLGHWPTCPEIAMFRGICDCPGPDTVAALEGSKNG